MMISGHNREIAGLMHGFLTVIPLILVLGALMALRMPGGTKKSLAYALLILGLVHIGVFEYVREHARRPFLIYDYLYSNSIYKHDVPRLNQEGFLPNAKWSAVRELTADNHMQAGYELFSIQCQICHSIGGRNDIRPLTEKFSVFGLDAQLTGQGRLNKYMPPFVGTPGERQALAEYIVKGLNGGDARGYADYKPTPEQTPVPAFDADNGEYVLLAWNNLGMHCISDSSPWWVLLPPANDIFAQLIRRGTVPEVVTEGVTLSFKVQEGFERPQDHVRFWESVQAIFGADLEPGVGLSGLGMEGEMHLKEDLSAFAADLIPVVPYPDSGGYNPYPLFFIEARDKSGGLLASTTVVGPTSTEMGCRNCHGGEWRVAGVAGFTDETSKDVLAVHDKLSGTNLLEMAEAGEPKLCQSCHADPVLGTEGDPKLLNFPASLHGFHANYLTDRGADACHSCHPNNPNGPTRCLRDFHSGIGMDCTSCHGALEDHALSLLKKEHEAGKPGAARLMENLKPRTVASLDEVKGRTPWLMEPDCTSCHDFAEKPFIDDTGFNKWTSGDPQDLFRMRMDDMGSIMCEACHGSTHATYPVEDTIFGKDRDVIQPLQYQGNTRPIGAGEGNCGVCHMDSGFTPDMSVHHPMVGF
jgi:mono/diheme cytochrome c family protein